MRAPEYYLVLIHHISARRENIRNRKQVKDGKSLPKNKVVRPRLIITFEDGIDYQFLLGDHEELPKLEENSYLDLDYPCLLQEQSAS